MSEKIVHGEIVSSGETLVLKNVITKQTEVAFGGCLIPPVSSEWDAAAPDITKFIDAQTIDGETAKPARTPPAIECHSVNPV